MLSRKTLPSSYQSRHSSEFYGFLLNPHYPHFWVALPTVRQPPNAKYHKSLSRASRIPVNPDIRESRYSPEAQKGLVSSLPTTSILVLEIIFDLKSIIPVVPKVLNFLIMEMACL